MARKRIYMVLVVAMTVGAVFAIGTYRYVQARPANTPQAVNTAKVVVAASNMDVGAALRAEDLRAIDWPAGSVPEGAFHKADELVGRGLIQPVVAFEPILPSQAVGPGSRRRSAAGHPRGYARAVGARQRRHRRCRLRAPRDSCRRAGDRQPERSAQRRRPQN